MIYEVGGRFRPVSADCAAEFLGRATDDAGRDLFDCIGFFCEHRSEKDGGDSTIGLIDAEDAQGADQHQSEALLHGHEG